MQFKKVEPWGELVLTTYLHLVCKGKIFINYGCDILITSLQFSTH